MDIFEIREGRKVVAFEYRGVCVNRVECDGVTMWRHNITRYFGGRIDRDARTKAQAIEQIDKALRPGRTWGGKPVIYYVVHGELIDGRLVPWTPESAR